MIVCTTEQEQRVWDAAYGASHAVGSTVGQTAGIAFIADEVADEAVEGLRLRQRLARGRHARGT